MKTTFDLQKYEPPDLEEINSFDEDIEMGCACLCAFGGSGSGSC